MRFGRRRGTGSRVTVLVVLVAVAPLLMVAMLAQHRQDLREEDRSLAFEATEQAARLEDSLQRARSLAQILAQNPAFRHFYEAPGRRVDKVRGGIRPVRESNEALAHLERLFPGQIGEACFIDVGGAENARAVKGKIAPLADLSNDETGASFFKPSFALAPGEVHQSRPYVSPDTDEWVIANTAPIPRIGGKTRAIVHFEITLESVREAAASASAGRTIQVTDRYGRILIDTGFRQRAKSPLAPRARPHTHGGRIHMPKRPHVHLPAGGDSGLFIENGRRAAFQRLSPSKNNANRWIVVVRSSDPRPGWFKSLSAWQLALLGFVLALVPLALLSWRRSQQDLTEAATTDGLTGLGNRRSLAEKLDDLVPSASAERPLLLTLYDLDGFKLYNDTYGHPAGDALLTRLGTRLADAVQGTATAFRMGGDEFCVVSPLAHVDQSLRLASAGAEALREHGEGFAVEASFGSVLLPLDTATASEALRLADQRMYAQKSSSRMSASRQSTDVLLRVLSERDPTLGEHVSSVAELAAETALRLGLSREEVEEIRRTGALHDVGKLAIPESILQKPRPLDETEWRFVRTHPAIGERILGAAPALAKVGSLVRATHERWDGAGYPDKLRGEEIPLGARIVTVCDAFEAMTSERPYRAARTVAEALAELRHCAGSQFDATVVSTFEMVVDARIAAERERTERPRSAVT